MGNNDDIFMARHSAFSPYRVRHSDMGYQRPIGAGDAMAKSLYCGMKPMASWTNETSRCLPTGGVFNLEFSPEGSLLVAACEKRSIQIFDPLTHKRIHSVVGAHMDCVNCVKFLDGRMFATCSDDTTIALWDVRNLKKKIRSLFGHSKWVKNIEFSVKDKLLVTSGLDGSIYTWDINSYTESNLVYERVFHTSSLMRCRLSPDAKQMVLCTTGGLLVVIHDLNLVTLAHDLHGFKPNLYRLMQMSNQSIPVAAMYDHLFDSSRRQNRVEFVSDFPEGNDAEVVSALQIHPQGWSALSRNISHDDRSEWTCVHDIQGGGGARDKGTRDASPPPARRLSARRRLRARPRPYHSLRVTANANPGQEAHLNHIVAVARVAAESAEAQAQEEAGGARRGAGREPLSRPRVALVAVEEYRRARARVLARAGGPGGSWRAEPGEAGPGPAPGPGGADPGPGDAGPGLGDAGAGPGGAGLGPGGAGPGPAAAEAQPDRRLPGPGRSAVVIANAAADAAASRLFRGIQNDVWEASITIKQHRLLQEIYSRGQVRPNFNMQRITGVNTGITPPQRPSAPCDHTADRPSTSGHSPRDSAVNEEARGSAKRPIRQNQERLLYYIEETNEGKGFIKELCYSADGRIVCSPFGRGMRLLALNDSCSELSQCVTEEWTPRHMTEVGQSLGVHQDLVVSSKFSPRYHLLVTGCLEGKIVWYQPHSGEM